MTSSVYFFEGHHLKELKLGLYMKAEGMSIKFSKISGKNLKAGGDKKKAPFKQQSP